MQRRFLEAVNRSDVRVIELSQHLGLALEASEALRVVGHLGRQHLDGDAAFQPGVPRPVHLAHAALTEQFKDLVVTEGFADHGR